MTYTHFGEMFERLPIFAAATLLGLISSVSLVHLITTRAWRLSLRGLMGGVALAALLSSLIAAKPEAWWATVELWALAAAVMGVLDLSVSCLLEPWRRTRRFSVATTRRMRFWLPTAVVVVVAGVLADLKLRFDFPLNTTLTPSFAAMLVVGLAALAALDLLARLAATVLGRRSRTSAGRAPRAE